MNYPAKEGSGAMMNQVSMAKYTVAVCSCGLLFALAGCVGSDEDTSASDSPVNSAKPTASAPDTESGAISEGTQEESPAVNGANSSTQARPVQCNSEKQNPLVNRDFLPIVNNPTQGFSFSITEDHYDSCAELSWSVIAGGVGTGGFLRQGVVFFHRGDPITNPAPLMQEKVDRVTAVDHASVRVDYQVLDGPRVAQNTIPGSATFTVNEGGSLSISDNILPPQADEAGIQVDVSTL